MSHLKDLEPGNLWSIFYDLTQIPRPSKSEQEAAEFAKTFGEKLGLETIQDKAGNIIIKKPATPGMEDKPGIILQAHLDMVPQKNNNTDHDFEKDPIQAFVDDEWVTAKGTTLGADNGIGVAAALAIMSADDIKHGPVEALLTIDEETGMTGAFNLEPGILEGKILVNLDSEDEGELYIGCAGGINTSARFNYINESVPDGMKGFKLIVSGLKGGHSGLDIHLGRGNSNQLLIRFMYNGFKKHGLRLSEIDGGSLRNAIPRESSAIVTVPEKFEADFLKSAEEYRAIFITELGSVEPDLSFEVEPVEIPRLIIDRETQKNLIKAICGLPNGVLRMSPEMPGVVETSSNLAIVKSGKDNIEVLCLLRSSIDTAKDNLAKSIQCVLELAGAEVIHDGEYPGWKPDVDSPILATMKEVYNKDFGKVPDVKVIHAGLECGIIGDAYKGLDMISFGPTIRFPHSPDEKVHIGTVKKFWDFLVSTLENVE